MNYIITDFNIKDISAELGIEERFLKKVLKNHCVETITRTERDDSFDSFWKIYKRKGNKKQAYKEWLKLTPQQIEKIFEHAPKYVASRELKFCKDAERYLKHEVYYDEIFADSDAKSTREGFIDRVSTYFGDTQQRAHGIY